MLTSDVTTIQLTLLDCLAFLEKQSYQVNLGKPFKINDKIKLNPQYFQPQHHPENTAFITLKNISYHIDITKNEQTSSLILKLIFTKIQNNNSYDDFFEQDYRRKISAKLQPLNDTNQALLDDLANMSLWQKQPSNNDKQSLPADLQQLKFNLKGRMITNDQLPLNDIFQLSVNQNLCK